MSGVNEIRSMFLDYFRKNGHEVVPSSPLVPRNDPTLMFTNAGMVQFKNVFTGLEQRPYSTAATAQKCVRAGGKHNDLDNVGYTARHHTFFEMLGNFSFGDYFKERAIELAWNLITKEYGLDAKRLLVTVYHTDDEAFGLWKKIAGLSDDRIIRIATSDNFWAMGDTGPCGPCSEIFYDHGDHIWGGPPGSADEDGDRFIEIWNLVFMQYEQITKEERVDLPRPSIDTGMGLERLAAVLQGQHDNYDIDLFRALIAASEEATGVKAEGDRRASHRVIADHLRSSAFLIADGVLPSNEGRGYVLRRIMRRAMRHAQLLGAQDPLMWKLLPALVGQMGRAYPELVRAEALISETLKLEETRFRKTLERGLNLLEEASADLSEGDQFNGETAFKLYDTYGFPLDLTQDALRAKGIGVDTDAFTAAMQRQKAEARANWTGSGDAATETIWFELRDKHGATDFLGYDTESAEGVIQAIVRDGTVVESASKGETVQLVLNQTPFYGESGGQVGDTGVVTTESGKLTVTDTQKRGEGLFVHYCVVEEGSVKTGEAAALAVDHARRTRLRANHSATHLLHEALREVLGTHVSQKGSLVAPERLRFDVSHPKPMTSEELKVVEEMANEIIVQNTPVVTRLMSVDDAIAEGAMALFGEKYGDEVRVVSMGQGLHGSKAGKAYSVELCGGTHVSATGDIGLVRIVSESAVGSGVRRVEALTGEAARAYLGEQDERVKALAAALKVQPSDVLGRVESLLDERRKLERELTEAKKKLALAGDGQNGSGEAAREIGGVRFLGRVVSGVEPKDLKSLADDGKKTLGSGVVAFVGVSGDGKASAVVAVTDDLTSKVSAVDLVRVASAALGGKGGGGRPDMAQAGGPDGGRAAEAIEAVAVALAG
ncbi:alanine--tRNA ligase [Sinorhizobium medicae]|uniref:Alanine--tRNA ligase n=1 Tax=Sinorhizobium medicae (strain WSM419) TaxID=366394 RepID=SYA_SINMW|nr:alanine--tRNA ligase [Sinorhizobium medicae]A6U9N4.1 RecName: Full=Alanine--tRNA ligase; AltName: Full=Alanyl-tRNA synthetase; Short=AlaRS [Sinorhizobium medicae WSM419]ABR60364.1 alanyl-tRNA synthetase [Sinorhizobium medicae WSM419]MDX0478614.1 alanine--tRNA ligase [Sinorhizobium medicae]MDX0837009.1 alanine--tRNA ligase [Sinorhizobium medicae]MDX0851044.1 alanine--tRNA ligase [Sinorhizobium medicae]MDX0900513.1 alanine--tRNA ligase [Sinorhizobium medicae]